MRNAVLFISPLVLGALVVGFVWMSSERARMRYAILAAVLGSIVVAYEALFLSACEIGDNPMHGNTCRDGSEVLLVLLGIPVLLLGAWGVGRSHGPLPWLAGAVLLVVVVVAPFAL